MNYDINEEDSDDEENDEEAEEYDEENDVETQLWRNPISWVNVRTGHHLHTRIQ